MDSKERQKVRVLIPIPRWSERHQYPSERQLRWLIFTGKDGFDSCVVRVGKRVLIDEELFFEWVERQSATRGGH